MVSIHKTNLTNSFLFWTKRTIFFLSLFLFSFFIFVSALISNWFILPRMVVFDWWLKLHYFHFLFCSLYVHVFTWQFLSWNVLKLLIRWKCSIFFHMQDYWSQLKYSHMRQFINALHQCKRIEFAGIKERSSDILNEG